MQPPLMIERLVRTNPPIYEGSYNGATLQVRLDTSAVLKLQGTSSYERLAELLDPVPPKVITAARRLIKMRQAEIGSEAIVITLSGLDLD